MPDFKRVGKNFAAMALWRGFWLRLHTTLLCPQLQAASCKKCLETIDKVH